MYEVPASLKIKRSKESEALLNERSRHWIENGERTPGIHASDLLSPRLAYWNRMKPGVLPERLINMFLIGRVLHAFILSAVDEKTGVDWSSDGGSKTSEELGIEYSIDSFLGKIPRELKTSRAFYEPKKLKDLWSYTEQLLIYMAAENKLEGEIWVLYLNLRDKGKSAPCYRAYKVTLSQADLDALKQKFKETADNIKAALAAKDHRPLPLCQEYKCGRGNCDHFDDCKPEERWKPARVKKTDEEKEAEKAAKKPRKRKAV